MNLRIAFGKLEEGRVAGQQLHGDGGLLVVLGVRNAPMEGDDDAHVQPLSGDVHAVSVGLGGQHDVWDYHVAIDVVRLAL